jgi:hypothetical protein
MTNKNRTLITFCFSLALVGIPQEAPVHDLVEVRFIENSFHTGVIRMKDNRSNRMLYLSAPIFSMKDVDSATVYSGYDSKHKPYCDVIIRLKRSLRDSMYRVTERRLHSRIALIVDEKLRTPEIMNPFREPVVLAPNLDELQAKDLARRINEFAKKH